MKMHLRAKTNDVRKGFGSYENNETKRDGGYRRR